MELFDYHFKTAFLPLFLFLPMVWTVKSTLLQFCGEISHGQVSTDVCNKVYILLEIAVKVKEKM